MEDEEERTRVANSPTSVGLLRATACFPTFCPRGDDEQSIATSEQQEHKERAENKRLSFHSFLYLPLRPTLLLTAPAPLPLPLLHARPIPLLVPLQRPLVRHLFVDVRSSPSAVDDEKRRRTPSSSASRVTEEGVE